MSESHIKNMDVANDIKSNMIGKNKDLDRWSSGLYEISSLLSPCYNQILH